MCSIGLEYLPTNFTTKFMVNEEVNIRKSHGESKNLGYSKLTHGFFGAFFEVTVLRSVFFFPKILVVFLTPKFPVVVAVLRMSTSSKVAEVGPLRGGGKLGILVYK